ncbi:MAG: TolC family outer membrane protein [Pseudomonadota bacterium]|nr:TolC family outer membrane protein [Pseudomonadota bacterium]MDQ3228432.1 TolC family outer membrane protein [Pseudomonadota bacterium]
MRRRPLVFALALALLPTSAFAEDLLQTYELARNSDPQLSAAESQRLATREGAVQARAAMLPQISGDASINRSRSTSPSGGVQTDINGQPVLDQNGNPRVINGDQELDSTSRRLGVNLNQMVYDRSRFTTLQSQRSLSKASDFQLESAGDTLVTRTSQAYFNVLVATETLAAAEAQEAALKKQFDFADKRLEVGLAPITDVHEARAQYDSARANTIVVRNALEDAYQALIELTGVPVNNLKGLPDDFKPVLPVEQAAEGWVNSAIENNPALIAKKFQVESSEANIETARSGYWPSLYFNGGYGDNNTSSDRTFGGVTTANENGSRGPNIGLTLSVPIFSGGATQSRVRQAIAQRDVAQDELEQQKRALVRNTRNAYQTLVAGISEVEARRLAVFSARSAYDASQVGLEVGTRTVLDVLNNQQTLFNAEREYALARYNFLQNRLLLEQAAGTLDVADVQDVNRLLTVTPETRLRSTP